MTGLILLCLLMNTQYPIQGFWFGIQLVNLKMLKWDQYPFHDRTLFISQYSCHIMQASRVSLLARGCGLLFARCRKKVLLEFSKMGISISNFIRRLYHGCVGQLGTTIIPMATSKTILCIIFPITTKGGNV